MRWILAAMLATGSSAAVTPLGHEQEIAEWRAQRLERLRAPQGWLTLVGLHWIEPGRHTLGRAPDNAIVLATGPERLGLVEFAEGKVRLEPHPEAALSVDGVPRADAIELAADSTGTPTVVAFDGGEATLQLIERGGQFGLRVRDARAATRRDFAGLDNYPIDASWRFEARFEPHPEGRTIPIANVIGQLEPMKNPGAVVFEREGRSHRLEAVDEGDGQLFLIFADRSNRDETYGAGRFLYAAAPVAGRTVVDFNKAYNPPCAFNAYSTCPLPPPENRLDLLVRAGEKRYPPVSR